jgi:CRP/FNR family transcriptional regulator
VQDTVATRFYYILRGKAKAFISSEDGNERILTVYRAGDLMGEASFFDEQPRVSSAVALTQCELIPIDRRLTQQLFSAHPELAMAMLKYLARTVRLLSSHVDDISFLSAGKRIARLLLTLYGDTHGFIHSTQDEIGFAVGVSRITVSRVLGEFAQKGWLKTGYRIVELLDLPALQKFTEDLSL